MNKEIQRNLMNTGHYENFPVGSIFLPARLRAPIRAIYTFARSADDFADEGDDSAQQRLAKLAEYHAYLNALERGEAVQHPVFKSLQPHIQKFDLPYSLFHDLLSAFEQDCTKTRYAHFGEVMDYCKRSANPIGRLLLKLYGDEDVKHQAWSDGICSALQLINFLQDVAVDWKKNRIYLPQDEMAKFGISERQIAEGRCDALWQQFMKGQIERARRMLQAGAPLGLALKGRIGFEMRLIILGGERILLQLHESRGDMFQQRPKLVWKDWLNMLWRATYTRPVRAGKTSSCGSGGCGH